MWKTISQRGLDDKFYNFVIAKISKQSQDDKKFRIKIQYRYVRRSQRMIGIYDDYLTTRIESYANN